MEENNVKLDEEILQRLPPAFKVLVEFIKNPPPKKPVQSTLPFYNDKAYVPANCKGGETK